MSKFSERITDIMNKRHITQKQLAEMANVTESAMSYYVKGGRTPRIDTLSRLAAALNVTIDYLLGVKRTKGNISTIFPDIDQSSVIKRRKKR